MEYGADPSRLAWSGLLHRNDELSSPPLPYSPFFARSNPFASGKAHMKRQTPQSCVVIFPIMFIFDLPFTIYVLLIPASVFLAGFLATGVGILLAPLNCVYRDIEHLVRFIVRAGFFVSPVMWTYEMALERGIYGEAAMYNPMLTPITLARHGLEGHATTLPSEIILWTVFFGCLMWFFGSIAFEKYERRSVKYL